MRRNEIMGFWRNLFGRKNKKDHSVVDEPPKMTESENRELDEFLEEPPEDNDKAYEEVMNHKKI
jgi:hypothetical protein